MQFFPSSSSGGVSALGGVSLRNAKYHADFAPGKINAFLATLNGQLARSGVTPIVDISRADSLPKGFRTIKRDVSAKLDDEDASLILNKLRKRGVNDSALAGIEGMLASDVSPTIGNIMATIGLSGRGTGELTDSELQGLTAAFQKLRFSADEAEYLIGLMQGGEGHEAANILRARARETGSSPLPLNKSEINAIMRGLDLSGKAIEKVAGLLGAGDDPEIGGNMLETLLGPAAEEFAAKRSEQEKLATELKSVIGEALQAKKIREATTPVADTRGSRKADRAETRMRDDLTAKANGFGQAGREGLQKLEEKETLADENAAQQRKRDATRENAAGETRKEVPAGAAGKEESGRETGVRSQAREGFSTIIHRVEVSPGMATPVQSNLNSGQQNASAALAHRQEIFSRVEQGMLRQLQDGTRQMTLRLDPAELGQLTIVVSVRGGEVRAMIRAENPETTMLLSEQMQQLRQTFEEQGLRVAQLDVETRLPQDTTGEQFSDMAQLNQEQEMREQTRFLQLAKLRREAGRTLAQNVQSESMPEENSASGLHIIA